GTYSYAGNVTCTAQWTANQINLVWDNNNATSGGTGGGDTCTFDGSITLPTVPTRTGYEFGGWEVVNTPAGSQQQSGN
ncbi:MAG: InlB B-repeat-containing protein, partial [Alphaproteobacteria bacterium]|nr:InlB B-repeat-containing protein [Alphaproteobacteria bacterium]